MLKGQIVRGPDQLQIIKYRKLSGQIGTNPPTKVGQILADQLVIGAARVTIIRLFCERLIAFDLHTLAALPGESQG